MKPKTRTPVKDHLHPFTVTDIDPDAGPLRTDWYDAHGWHKGPTVTPRKRRGKDARIAELEEEVRRLKRELEDLKTDYALRDPHTGRPRRITCRKPDRWPKSIIRML